MPSFVVETVSITKVVYVVEADQAEHAADVVVCGDADPALTRHLDEVVSGVAELGSDGLSGLAKRLGANEDGLRSAVARVDYRNDRVVHPYRKD